VESLTCSSSSEEQATRTARILLLVLRLLDLLANALAVDGPLPEDCKNAYYRSTVSSTVSVQNATKAASSTNGPVSKQKQRPPKVAARAKSADRAKSARRMHATTTKDLLLQSIRQRLLEPGVFPRQEKKNTFLLLQSARQSLLLRRAVSATLLPLSCIHHHLHQSTSCRALFFITMNRTSAKDGTSPFYFFVVDQRNVVYAKRNKRKKKLNEKKN
jgi:hypothetical protein